MEFIDPAADTNKAVSFTYVEVFFLLGSLGIVERITSKTLVLQPQFVIIGDETSDQVNRSITIDWRFILYTPKDIYITKPDYHLLFTQEIIDPEKKEL
ncbi:13544_t:CDS:2 [Ambispora gerdemannii]|uniref:13544_t:CDS:1 n=1 Tax=Ambispora gerdemannii TaxID=144530 RepID=A0A9N8Z269_9GLOM|nr:13544_t:CDS:2 [Ambispora gerdemannii]